MVTVVPGCLYNLLSGDHPWHPCVSSAQFDGCFSSIGATPYAWLESFRASTRVCGCPPRYTPHEKLLLFTEIQGSLLMKNTFVN